MKIAIMIALLASLQACASNSLNEAVGSIMYSTQAQRDHMPYAGPYQFAVAAQPAR